MVKLQEEVVHIMSFSMCFMSIGSEKSNYFLGSGGGTEATTAFISPPSKRKSSSLQSSSISSAAASFDNEEDNNTGDSILSSSRGGNQSHQSTEIQQTQRALHEPTSQISTTSHQIYMPHISTTIPR